MTVNNADDIVDVLLEQHRQIRQLCMDVQAAGGDERRRLFESLARLIHSHEFGEQAVVHPVTRDRTTGGASVTEILAAEEETAGRVLAELEDLGVGHPAFDAAFAGFHQAVVDHAAHEERDEFPLLRQWVAAQRRHLMANEFRNVETMA